MQAIFSLLARVFLTAIFFKAAFGKITNFSGTQKFMASKGMPVTGLLLAGAIVFLVAGGLSVLLGYRTRLGSLLLIIFIVPTTLIFHTDFSIKVQMIMFMKNASIMGGLLMVMAFGPGAISLDGRSSRK